MRSQLGELVSYGALLLAPGDASPRMARLSEARSKPSFGGLVRLSVGSQLSEAAFGVFSAVIVVAAVAAIATFGWSDMHTGVRIALIALLTIAAGWVALWLKRLHTLALRGVEVEAELVGVTDELNETNYRVATYRYEYAGQTYFVKCIAADFQMSSATRYGQSAVALVNPAAPREAMLLRSR